jgi:hypothetical protein
VPKKEKIYKPFMVDAQIPIHDLMGRFAVYAVEEIFKGKHRDMCSNDIEGYAKCYSNIETMQAWYVSVPDEARCNGVASTLGAMVAVLRAACADEKLRPPTDSTREARSTIMQMLKKTDKTAESMLSRALSNFPIGIAALKHAGDTVGKGIDEEASFATLAASVSMLENRLAPLFDKGARSVYHHGSLCDSTVCCFLNRSVL